MSADAGMLSRSSWSPMHVQKLSVTGNCTGTQLQGKMPVLHYYMGGCCISTIHSPGYMIRAFVLGL